MDKSESIQDCPRRISVEQQLRQNLAQAKERVERYSAALAAIEKNPSIVTVLDALKDY